MSNNSYTGINKCFLEGNKFLQNQKNVLIVTDESTIVYYYYYYYYYMKQFTHFYLNSWSYNSLKNLIEDNYPNK